ncbi:hypothetical protein OKA05_23925 [Luteolibacter arcticus]|uniref:Uncharacterized protein n=1 Tax=Luteolibacter arcticus TaxID=1581411 RepID=A0ABT3GQ48_9BACT|nr:hypothetical protein [Luteolibacter arcticus]MCW1925628.1 hypothetical protein [Luteolibacter arcticus]
MSSSIPPGGALGSADAPEHSGEPRPQARPSAYHRLGLVFAAVLILLPVILRRPHDDGGTKAINNLKQRYLALTDFGDDYGRFPDAATIEPVRSATGTRLPLGSPPQTSCSAS